MVICFPIHFQKPDLCNTHFYRVYRVHISYTKKYTQFLCVLYGFLRNYILLEFNGR